MNRKYSQTLLSALVILIAVSSAAAQGSAKPGPELKKLDYFVGTWTVDATVGPGPWGAGGKFTATGTTEWMDGGFFLVDHSDSKMPPELGGDVKEMSVMGYDPNQSVYTFNSFSNSGRHESSTGTVAGDTWTWNSEANYGGQNIKQRMTEKILSPTTYTMKFEVSMDGTNWMLFMEGKGTKK